MMERYGEDRYEGPGFVPLTRPSLGNYDGLEGMFREIWSAGQVTSCKHARRLEETAVKRLGVDHAVAVSSCTSGMMLAMKGLDLSGEVILPSFTFSATVHAAVWAGLKPVFCDCLPGTYCIDPEGVEELLSDETSAIIGVNVFGVPPDVRDLERLASRFQLKLLFDSAQGIGSIYGGKRVGAFGDAEVFSLSPTKVVTAVEGGLVTCSDGGLAKNIRKMRDYGKSEDGEDVDFIGMSARMSEFHAAVGWNNLERVDALVRKREELVSFYREELDGIPGISFQEVPPDRTSSFNYFVIFIDPGRFGRTRDDVGVILGGAAVQTKKYFFPPAHDLNIYRQMGERYRLRLRVTEKASSESLALPLFDRLDRSEIKRICHYIKLAASKAA